MDFAAPSRRMFYEQQGILRSPSPTYSLPPAADAMARHQALQTSPVARQSRTSLDSRASIFIDNEAAALESDYTRTTDLMNSEASTESSLNSY
jgi:hypothetical protein